MFITACDETPMDDHFSLMKYFFIICIACMYIQSAESGMRPRKGQHRGARWTSVHLPPPKSSGPVRQVASLPEDRQEHSFDPGAAQEVDTIVVHQRFGGFFRKKRTGSRSGMPYLGRFNSDTVSYQTIFPKRGKVKQLQLDDKWLSRTILVINMFYLVYNKLCMRYTF